MQLNDAKTSQTEVEEQDYLESVKCSLQNALDIIDARVTRYAKEIQEQKDYSWEHRAEMDHIEKISNRESIAQAMFTGEAALEKKQSMHKP